jgi:cysteinyl-tRNA synthetase
MAEVLLGRTFDIHGGGIDLIFPHHENEIAQSRCAHDGAPLARYWMHNGFVQVNGEKMSKSLGNYFTVRELLEGGHRGEAIRLALLSAHYRQPLDITRDGLVEAKAALDRFYAALDRAGAAEGEGGEPSLDLMAALEDDLNTPLALSHLHELLARLNKASSAPKRQAAASALKRGGAMLGLLEAPPDQWLRARPRTVSANLDLFVAIYSDEKIDELIRQRADARKARDFAEADRIRDELLKDHVILEDRPGGKTGWRRA